MAYTTHVQFDRTGDGAGAPDAPPRVRFNLRNHHRAVAEQRYEVTLELKVTCEAAHGALWQLAVNQAGVFDLAHVENSERVRTLNTTCSRALLPLAKQVADALVQRGGFLAFELPAVDFEAVYARYHQHARTAPGPLDTLQAFWRAVGRLQAAGQGEPRPADFHARHGEALAVAQLSRDALPAADQILATVPRDKPTLDALAAAYSMNDVHRRTAEVYALAVTARPGDARAHYNLAAALMFNGDLEGAEREIDRSIELQPAFWDAYTVRSQVRRQTAANHIDGLAVLLQRHGGEAQAVERLNMALGKEYEDVGDYARAFAHYAEGNHIGKLRRRYDFARDARVFDALAAHPPRPDAAATGCASAEPIFVFGMPRSGTTLVDRILSSHLEVTSAGELKQFGMLLKYACGSPTEAIIDADTIARAQALDWRALGARYLANTRPVTGKARHFVDKFPHHFLYAGYLANALPNTKLVCLRRNPLDTCLGNFRQVFSEGSPFHGYACDLMDAGHYYVRFDRLMRQWQEAFPGRILEVQYEALVADQEAVTRRLLDFCGLPWDPACLAFERNHAPVSTASAVQVRAPIYHDAVARWKHYATQLEPLRELLAQAGVAVPTA
jgi:protein-export chaperone SecB